MRYRIIFYDLADKWEAEVTSASGLTCREAAALALAERGEPEEKLKGVIYLAGSERMMSDTALPDGTVLSIHRLLGGG